MSSSTLYRAGLLAQLRGARKNSEVAWAARRLQDALRYADWQQFYDSVAWDTIRHDEELLREFLSIFRVAIDAGKSLANASFFPREVRKQLARIGKSIRFIAYDNGVRLFITSESTSEAIKTLYVEMLRDWSKVLASLAELFSGTERERILFVSEDILRTAIDMLPPGHPTRFLSQIELGLAIGWRRGKLPIDQKLALLVYTSLLFGEMHYQNHHRVATVAAWLMTRKTGVLLHFVGFAMFFYLFFSRDKRIIKILQEQVVKQTSWPFRQLMFVVLVKLPLVGVSRKDSTVLRDDLLP